MSNPKATAAGQPQEPAAGPPEEAGDVAAEVAVGAPEAKALEERVRELGREKVDLLAKLARAQADLSNLKRRTQQEAGDVLKFANQLFATEMLGGLDSMERALASIPEGLQGFTWIDGLAIVRAQIEAILRSQGVEPIKAMGEPFDPKYHDAVVSEAEAEAEYQVVVLEEFQRGYMMHGRVLRPALVRVGTAPTAGRPPAEAGSEPPHRHPGDETPSDG